MANSSQIIGVQAPPVAGARPGQCSLLDQRLRSLPMISAFCAGADRGRRATREMSCHRKAG
ncbi:hypothetical protein BJY24_004811 [Nocardia transvalensis]|uniref:Uncharacterized protein n=1 Tax=Nocardia transvalensis TaxID=37333 RepID=A0A7W9PHU9_9NOCA|nr:hypothetical protein [Nocardia transvalensis]MBB5915899.1 hypothetical protein [Nocardia transvalensis]